MEVLLEDKINTMDNIKVKKEVLLEALRENLKNHNEIYEEAIDNYWKQVKENFQEKVDVAMEQIENRALNNGGIALGIRIEAPENHSLDYERTIHMMELNVREEITLTARDFNRYIRNEWDWAESFLASNSVYTATSEEGVRGKFHAKRR